MVCLNLLGFMDHVISVGREVVLNIPFISVPHFDMGAIGVGRFEAWDFHQVSLCLGVVDP